jgi:uncharacterized membrane protein
MQVNKSFSILSIILGAISFVAATVLTLDKIKLLMDPSFVPACSISPFVACGPVMSSPQASAFIIPNSVIGMIAFTLVVFIGILSLFTVFPKWFWYGYTAGIALGMGFIIWLMTQSLYVISALCIYCMCVWVCMILLFWFSVGNIVKDTKLNFINEYKTLFIIASYVAVALAIFFRFETYWVSLLS